MNVRLLLLSLPLLVTGCAALPLAAVGTVAGITATAVSTGADVYSMGKLDSAELATLDDVHGAVHQSAEEMGFELRREQAKPNVFGFEFIDQRNSITKVTLEARTPRLMRIRINVGVFGNEPTARLMLKRIRTHLPNEGERRDAADGTTKLSREMSRPAYPGSAVSSDERRLLRFCTRRAALGLATPLRSGLFAGRGLVAFPAAVALAFVSFGLRLGGSGLGHGSPLGRA
jgi:hypothetical protein